MDIETTGLDPGTDETVPPLSSAVHHLIDEDLNRAARLEEVIPQFRGAKVYVAHNCSLASVSATLPGSRSLDLHLQMCPPGLARLCRSRQPGLALPAWTHQPAGDGASGLGAASGIVGCNHHGRHPR